MRLLICLLLLVSSAKAFCLSINFNQAWFKNSYGHQFLNKSFDINEVERIFKLANNAHAKSVRIWLFESAHFPMIYSNSDKQIQLKREFINNVLKTLEMAKKYDLKVYATLFDAHQFNPIQYSLKNIFRLRSILNDHKEMSFFKNIVSPLLKEIERSSLNNVIDKLDLVNEVDTLVNRFGFNKSWKGAKRFLCTWKKSLTSLYGYSTLQTTMSVRLHPLTPLPKDFLNINGPMKCADFVDFHSYNDRGEINRCEWIKNFSSSSKKKLILGEFGQSFFNKVFNDDLQLKVTKNYIKNAKKCGFSEAFAWRLSDVRTGHNTEARYSFEAFNRLRPAYYLIRDHNINL